MSLKALFCGTALLSVLSVIGSQSASASDVKRTPQFTHRTAFPQPAGYRAVPDVFAQADFKILSDSDLDRYIARSVVGPDRAIARKIMKSMPFNQRGDFVYVSLSGHLVSNNPNLLKLISLQREFRSRQFAKPASVARESKTPLTMGGFQRAVTTADYHDTCSPPDPPSVANGAYVRQVSVCGFTASISFVNVECGTSYFATSGGGGLDEGQLYIELAGNSGGYLYEGGLQYNNDSSVEPYVRQSGTGYLTTKMTNYNASYSCGQNLVIASGILSDGSMTFTEVGVLDSSDSPQNFFISQEEITPENASYLFYQANSAFSNAPGQDKLGVSTPCTSCSVSRVTSIAQYSSNYSIDGSYFGVDVNGNAAINWAQVAFGEWEPGCANNGSVCTLEYSSQPSFYYGGPEVDPNNSSVVMSNVSNINGYGPYESFDAINLSGGSALLRPAAAFREPLPPPPCTMDSHGYCSTVVYSKELSFCNTGSTNVHGAPIDIYLYKDTYDIYQGNFVEEVASSEQHAGSSHCEPVTTTWAPEEPAVEFEDTSLP